MSICTDLPNKMKTIKCPNKRCKHEWNYSGTARFYATCPICRYKVWIDWTAEQLEVLEQIKELEEEMKSEQGVGSNNKEDEV